MRPILLACTLAATIGLAAPATAALKVGAKAPDFETLGAIASKPFKLHLADQLKKGPVVLYFFPKAFTSGCTAEAHAFSDASAAFKKAGAQVIGMSADDLPTLQKFSVTECRNSFAVASASKATIKAYDVKLPMVSMTNRTSYVIAKDGQIMMVHSDMSWKEHVAKSLAAVQALKR